LPSFSKTLAHKEAFKTNTARQRGQMNGIRECFAKKLKPLLDRFSSFFRKTQQINGEDR